MKHYEADDPGRLDELVRSRAYGLVREFLGRALELARLDLEKPGDADRTAQLRGKIEALRQALDAPAQVLRDVKAELQRNPVKT